MKLYFALSYSPFTEMRKCEEWNIKNILVSFYVLHYISNTKNIRKVSNNQYNLFLDSGAFSAFTKNKRIDIREYIKFIKQTKDLWEVYTTLDVIGDWKKTRDNTEIMEGAGLRPLPVFHFNSPTEELERMVEKYDYIALGGLVPFALQPKKLQAWLDFCFSIIRDKAKVHGFGVNSMWVWKRYPFYSVDATSWNQGSKYGRVVVSDKLEILTLKRNKVNDFKYHYNKDWEVRTRQNIDVFLKAEKLVTKLWEKRGIAWN